MFQFVTLTMENYYVNRLLDMAHSRYRPDIALRYKHRELPQEYKRVDVKSVLLMEMHLSLKITRRTQPLEYQLVGFQESLEEIMDDMDKRAQEGDHNYISRLTKFISSYRTSKCKSNTSTSSIPCTTLVALTVSV